MRRVVRLVLAKPFSGIQPRRFITLGQTRRQFALTFESLRDVFDCDDESGNRVVITQRRNRYSLLHLIEMFGRSYRSTGDQILMKGGREHLNDALIERPLKTFQ